jgi:hypothetical protein
MIKQNVNIVNYNSLYEILEEIKDNLSFNIIRHENEEVFIKRKDNLKDSLISTNSNNKDLVNKQILIFNDLPLPLYSLVELININLIKLKFNYQSKIDIKDYELNLNSKFFTKKDS